MTDTDRLSDQIELFASRPARREARDRLLDLLIDAVGVGVAGAGAPVASRCLPALNGDDAASSAWMRGVCMHALDFDDTHEPSLCHTGTAIIPALLSLARVEAVSGGRLLDAFEVGLRFVEFVGPLGPRVNERGLHSTGILGTLGSAAAGAWLMTEDPSVTARAVELAGLMTGGLGVAFGNDGKPIQAGRAAEAGFRAAQLAAAAVECPSGAALGPHGIFAEWLGEAAPEQALWGDDCMGAALNVAIKPYPSCFLTHSTIDAVLALREKLGVGAERVTRCDVVVHPIAQALADKTELANSNDAKFSLRYCVLAGFERGTPTVDTFDPPAQAELTERSDSWRAWVERCSVGANPASTRLAATVSIETTDGRAETLAVAAPSGSASNPLGRDRILRKFRDNVADCTHPDGMLDELLAIPSASELRFDSALSVPWELVRVAPPARAER